MEPVMVKAGETIFILGSGVIVKEPCEEKTNGWWCCDSHQKAFNNQLQKDIHLSHVKSVCRLVWMCRKHGPEQP